MRKEESTYLNCFHLFVHSFTNLPIEIFLVNCYCCLLWRPTEIAVEEGISPPLGGVLGIVFN